MFDWGIPSCREKMSKYLTCTLYNNIEENEILQSFQNKDNGKETDCIAIYIHETYLI